MGKRSILLGLALAALAAFALPATAGALEMRDSSGKLPVGAEITGVSHDTRLTNTALGDLFCETFDFVARVTVNGPSAVTAVGTAGETAGCQASGVPLRITQPTVAHLQTSGSDKGTVQVSRIADVGPFECPFEGIASFTYGTGAGNDTITVVGTTQSPLEVCEPESGDVEVEGTFTLTRTANGKPVFIQ